MRSRDVAIPFFLWIALAILFHLSGRRSVEQVMTVVEEKRSIRNFAAKVRNEVRRETRPVEISLLNPTAEPLPPEEPEEPVPDKTKKEAPEKKAEAKPEEPKPEEPKPEEPTPEEKRAEKKPEEQKAPDEKKADPAKKPPELVLPPKRSIAVRQHYEDPNQEENKEAEFLGDKNNKVDEQTQSRITSTDQDEKDPAPGQKHDGPEKELGNADESRVASAEGTEEDGSPLPPEATPPKPQPTPVQPQPLPPEQQIAQGQRGVQTPTQPNAPREDKPAPPVAPPIAAGDQGDTFFTPAPRSSSAPKRLPPPPQKNRYGYGMGLGAGPTTPGGVNLNLSYNQAQAVVGKEQLEKDRKADSLRLRTKHRGSWAMVGLARWKSAIENYVPHVKPGNRTALNTRAVPFANYLNAMHQRIHVIFADEFLASLDQRPKNDPLNNYDMHTELELIISQYDGSLITMGVVRTSGVTAFDINALEAVSKASPFGKPPSEIVSPDGNVYVHWEFYRNPDYACSTYFAHPIILKEAPAPPKTPPPTRNPQRSLHGDFVPTGYTPARVSPTRSPSL